MFLGRALHAELLKLKRTLAVRMIFVGPLLVAALLFFALWERKSVEPPFNVWNLASQLSLNTWAIFMMPLLITLETALLNGIDHSEKNWKHVFALPLPRHSIYAAKLIIANALMAISTLFLLSISILIGLVMMRIRPEMAHAGAPPIGTMLKQAAMVWLASWLIIAIHNWVSIRWPGFVLPLGVGVGGTFFAIFAAGAKIGKFYPWLLPFNVFSAERVTMAMWLGIAGGVAAAIIGCVEFVRRDVI